MYAFGVDIGGTGIKAGIVDEKGAVAIKSSIVTDRGYDYRKIAADIAGQLRSLSAESGIAIGETAGIGVGCPGAINSKKGTVDYSNNIRWEDVPFLAELRKHIDLPSRISNDANVAALGETLFGAGKEYDDTVFITLGTGVGGGVVIGGKLFEGNEGKGTELGHMVIVRDGELCTCGRRGCLEAYASATALIRDTKVAMNKNKTSAMWDYVGGDLGRVDGRTAFECAKQGDRPAQKAVEEYLEYLGEGLCNFINIFRPQAIILGGGVCAQGEYLVAPLRNFIHNFAYGGEHSPSVDLRIATLGNDAGLIGAAALILSNR